MKRLMLLLAFGQVFSEKLDRTYLPPPGSKFAGGNLGAIDVPLEFPKQTYSTTLTPSVQGQKNKERFPEDSKLTVGIDRGSLPGFSQDLRPVIPGTKPMTSFQGYNKVPTTTTSYAFTQTTTFPPSEGFETTISPIGSAVPVYPSAIPSFPQLGQGQQISQIQPVFGQSGVQPGQPSVQLGQPGVQSGPPSLINQQQQFGQPTPGTPQQPGFPSPIPGQTFFGPGVQPQSQYQPSRPSSTPSPIEGNLPQSPSNQNQDLNQHLGVQPPTHLIGQQGILPSHIPGIIPSSVQQGVPQYYQPGTTIPSFNIPSQLGGQFPTPGGHQRPGFPSPVTSQGISPNYQPGTFQLGDNRGNVQSTFAPGYIPGQEIQALQGQPATVQTQPSGGVGNVSYYQPGQTQFQLPDRRVPQQFPTTGELGAQNQYQTSDGKQFQQLPPSSIPDAQHRYQSTDGRVPQGFSTTSKPGVYGSMNEVGSQQILSTLKPGFPEVAIGDSQHIYRPDATATSAVLPSEYSRQPPFPGTMATKFPQYGTTASGIYSATTPVYPGIASLGPVTGSSPKQYPERPQAESERNAIILNYENILTPEGFSYTFDTSNGIHADESGTAKDGVKAVGSYSYTGDDGKFYNVVYSADENGFQPRGDHLPTPPPVPEAIQRVIEQAAREKEAGISHDGSYDEDKYGHKKYQGPKNHNRPATSDKTIINGADIPEQYKNRQDEIENEKYMSKGGRRPISVKEDVPDDYKEDITNEQYLRGGLIDDRKKLSMGRIPSRYPSDIPDQDEYEIAYDDEKSIQENVSRQPAGSRIGANNVYSTGKDASARRPISPNRKPSKPGSSKKPYIDSQNEDNVEYEDDSQRLPMSSEVKQEKMSGRPKGMKRPEISSTKYTESKSNEPRLGINDDSDELEDDDYSEPEEIITEQQIGSARPKDSKRPGFSSSNLMKDQRRKPQRPGVTTYTDEEFGGDDENIPISSDFDGKDRPTFSHPNKIYRTKYPQQLQGSGYQYIPPRNKFAQGETTGVPSRLHEIGKTTKRPSDQKTTIQPFMTPNVSREDEVDEDDYVHNEKTFTSQKPGKPSRYGTTIIPPTQEGESKYYEKARPDYQVDDERTTYTSSTRRPSYKPGQVTIPQYSGIRDEISQKDTSRPGQMSEDTYPLQTTDKSKLRPGQVKYSGDRFATSKPGSTFISSTTPMPSQTPSRFIPSSPQDTYKQTTISKYPNTYQSMDGATTIDKYPDRTIVPGSIVGSDTSRIPSDRFTSRPSTPLRPGSGSSISSLTSTSRPDYSDRMTVSEPVTIRSGFTIPPDRQSGTVTDYSLPEQSSTIKPGSYRPDASSRFPTRPETSPIQNLPSTTYRPSYLFTDKSQPPQAVSVDGFGRPIPSDQSGQIFGTSTYRPDYTGTQGPASATRDYEQPGLRPSSHFPGTSPEVSMPYGQRLQKPVFGSTQIPYGSQKSDEPVPAPGQGLYFAPYGGQTSTEKILGEDFSGPKQPQRFDPETGYHY